MQRNKFVEEKTILLVLMKEFRDLSTELQWQLQFHIEVQVHIYGSMSSLI